MSETTFDEVIAHLRSMASSQREKGDLFERLMANVLPQLPEYKLDKVWMREDWVRSEHFPQGGIFNTSDEGIDLVGMRDDGSFVAIQCKFYDENHYLGKSDLDSFFTESGKEPFDARLIIATTENWSSGAKRALKGQRTDVQTITLSDLKYFDIDWDKANPTKAKVILERKTPLEHQREAIDKVCVGFREADRGKMIMACGTGKTLTSLFIAEQEELVPEGGRVLFLVPSIALLSQAYKEWVRNNKRAHQYLLVCSDGDAGGEDAHVAELSIPPTTDENKISNFLKDKNDKTKIVFCTYQSLKKVNEAQKHLNAPKFDLAICDEAHRTSGMEGAFKDIHKKDYIRAGKRLYMTATPKIYSDRAKSQVEAKRNVGVYSMDDEAVFGEEFYRLAFSRALNKGLLSDYKIVIFQVSEEEISAQMQSFLAREANELQLNDAAKIVGCYRALSGKDGRKGEKNAKPLKRAVSFCNRIDVSERIARYFGGVVSEAFGEGRDFECKAKHMDGKQGMSERHKMLDWLRADIAEGECRIISNAKCLTEGVDVPALDAIMFMQPRASQVDVVQAVGRVMRKAQGKDYGYIILPVVIPKGMTPEKALDNNKVFEVVWQVLKALRSHDDRFNIIINQIMLLDDKKPKEQDEIGDGDGSADGNGDDEASEAEKRLGEQILLNFPPELHKAIYGRIVDKCGDRMYWSQWARDVAQIYGTLETRISNLVGEGEIKQSFISFLAGLRSNINEAIGEEDAISMLAQQLITAPVFEALFGEDDVFSQKSSVAPVMNDLLAQLKQAGLGAELNGDNNNMKIFYESVKERVTGIKEGSGKQKLLVELYEKFFKIAFPKVSERLGIAYTPVELVDFILHSANHVLKQEFGRSLDSKNVHIIDPFVGTGTFINRLISDKSLISDEMLPHKYAHEIHANEIMLMAYYIAAANIETAYNARIRGGYREFKNILLTDTFHMHENAELGDNIFKENTARIKKQRKTDIQVIIGNPPWSAGQKSANDRNQNLKYPLLDEKIRASYAQHSSATSRSKVYDSYVRAIRWASDRIEDEGVIAITCNGGWLKNSSMAGVRHCLQQEFDTIWVYNLWGDLRAGDKEAEGGNIFDVKVPLTVLMLVKNGQKKEKATIHYGDIGTHLSKKEKLEKIAKARSIARIKEWQTITPDAAKDWINQRDPTFQNHKLLGSDRVKRNKAIEPDTIFVSYSNGVVTNRDAWCYNFSKEKVAHNMQRTIDFYNQHVGRDTTSNNPREISWTRSLRKASTSRKEAVYASEKIVTSLYRPFCKHHLYFDRMFNEVVVRIPSYFPSPSVKNEVITISGSGGRSEFQVFIADCVPDLNLMLAGAQCFPRYRYEKEGEGEFARVDNITPQALAQFQEQYGDSNITGDDIFYYVYGILHAPDYRAQYANNLMRELPRIPLVPSAQDFRAFVKAGRALADLHLTYETAPQHDLSLLVGGETVLDETMHPDLDYKVRRMRWANKEKTVLKYNERISLAGFPKEALEYVVNGKTALDWIIARYCLSTDKASNITNDANDWIAEQGDPQALIKLIKRITHISVAHQKIIKKLPKSL